MQQVAALPFVFSLCEKKAKQNTVMIPVVCQTESGARRLLPHSMARLFPW